MFRILARALVCFILFANLSWAADLQAVNPGHDPADTHLTDDTGGRHSDDSDTPLHVCDHCCHGSAHYVGIPPAASIAAAAPVSPFPAGLTRHLRSHAGAPPLPPPNI